MRAKKWYGRMVVACGGLLLFGGASLWAASERVVAAREEERPQLERGHPRLLLRAEAWEGGRSLAELRALCRTQPFSERLHLLRSTRANLALKWLLSGSEEDGAAALRHLRSLNDDLTTSAEGVELIDAALAYDWLYNWPGFSADDKEQIGARMLRLAAAMRNELEGGGAHIFHTRMYSWMAGVALAGLALHDSHPEAVAHFEFARRYYEERLQPARTLQDGTMHNGFSYGPNYMMFPLLHYLLAARSAANIDYFHDSDPLRSGWLRATALYLIHSMQPDLRHVKFADVATEDPAKQYCVMLDILAGQYRDGYAAELARQIRECYKTSGYHAEWIYLYLLNFDASVMARPFADLPTAHLFSPQGTGQLFMRSDWSAEAVLVTFRCGDYFENHGHFDQGGFTIFRRGPLALKGGSYRSNFDSEHRHHYYKQAISANTVIFSDTRDPSDEGRQRQIHYQSAASMEQYLAHKLPGAQPFVETGNIIAYDDPAWAESESSDFHHLAADLTAAWDSSKVRRYRRQLAFVEGRHLVVVDEIECTDPAIRVRWLLHSAVEPHRLADDADAAWEVRLTNSLLYARMLLPERPKATLIGGAGHEFEVNGINYAMIGRNGKEVKPFPEAGAWRLELETATPTAKRLFVAVLTACDTALPPPKLAAHREGKALVVAIDGRETRFLKIEE